MIATVPLSDEPPSSLAGQHQHRIAFGWLTSKRDYQVFDLDLPIYGATVTDDKYGFPPALMREVDDAFPGNAGTCGLCGDTILGGRHRVIDAICERLLAGESDAVIDDYDIPWAFAWVAVAASYEHTKALARQRRAERKVAS